MRAWFLGIVLALMAGVVSADCQVGQVTRVKGEAQLQRAGLSQTLQLRLSLCQEDVITTGAHSLAELHLADGSTITIAPQSRFVLHEFHYEEQSQAERSAVFELLQGAFRAVTGAITHSGTPFRYEVKTRVATIGVRGTDFWGGFYFGDALDVVMLNGTGVYVKNEQGTAELSAVGQGTTVSSATQAPSIPKVWPEKKLSQAIQSVNWD